MVLDISRRKFLAGSSLGALGLVLGTPFAAFADTDPAEPTPSFTVTVKDAGGVVVDAFGQNASNFADADVKIVNATRSVIANSDDSYSAVFEFGVKPKAVLRSNKDEVYDDLGVTIKVSIDYRFFRGKITVNSGSVELTNVVADANWISRYLNVAQGPFSALQTKTESFDGLSHTVVTGFTEIDYVPSGEAAMNAVMFSGVMSAPNMPEHLVTAQVSV